jgi:ABC-type lipoprotein export system ATPase subunit
MKKLTLDLEHCYGIRRLKYSFDFSKKNVYAIYAPNGAMKSSLAQTFQDLAAGAESKDRIFPARVTKRDIKDENGQDLRPDSVYVIRPYDEVLGHTEKTSTLLVNAQLREEYERLHDEIDKSKAAFLKAMKTQSKSKRDLEREISATFTKTDHELYKALIRLKDELAGQAETPFADVDYDTIFDEKVVAILQGEASKSIIAAYIQKYNELLEASTYFKRGVFTYYNASAIAKTLADHGFFKAKHSVSLNAAQNLEITSHKQLEELVTKEKDTVSSDPQLRRQFAELEKLLTKNASVRDFSDYLSRNEHLLPHLANLEAFREEIWKSYIKSQYDRYLDLVTKVQAAEARKKEIEKEAERQRTQWEEVIAIFNERFFVPFKLSAKNKLLVILGADAMLSLGFTFEDGADVATVEKPTLLEVLSTGEKKAFYILNIIFEIEARKKASQETLFIVDDIADSFDYKNKYAIIQYLKDIAEEPFFKQILLTHNFDFYRTAHNRCVVDYPQCLMASKSGTGVILEQASGIKNVFVNDWKLHFFDNARKRIASIPFIRNIVEYTKGEGDQGFKTLTSLLHWKSDTATILQRDLDAIYGAVFGEGQQVTDGLRPVVELVHAEAAACLSASEGINFENKIVLSIAIRLLAEKFMVAKIKDASFVNGITENQTHALFKRFSKKFATDERSISVIHRVVLMTPENIHLNSFMYEPILDMSDDHLRKLYQDVSALA